MSCFKRCKNQKNGGCVKLRDLWRFCECGCGESFPKCANRNTQRRRVMFIASCYYRRNRNLVKRGLAVVAAVRQCCVCGADVTIYEHETPKLKAERVTCNAADGNCSKKAVAGSPKRDTRRYNYYVRQDTSFRQKVCHPEGKEQCGDYAECLGDDGLFAVGIERHRETGGKCYKEPAANEPRRPAINYGAVVAA